MTAQKGSAFLLKISDGADEPGEPLSYETVAGLRTTQMSINGDTVVVTHKESEGWRDLLSGAGTRSVSVSASGIFLGSSAETQIRTHALAGTVDDYELSFEDGEKLRGRLPCSAARLCWRFQWRAKLYASARKLRRGCAGMSNPVNVPANSLRGEATLCINGTSHILRPTFAALVAAEDELGPLFALVERAGDGQLKLSEMAAFILVLPRRSIDNIAQ